jgi:hypothetical protein
MKRRLWIERCYYMALFLTYFAVSGYAIGMALLNNMPTFWHNHVLYVGTALGVGFGAAWFLPLAAGAFLWNLLATAYQLVASFQPRAWHVRRAALRYRHRLNKAIRLHGSRDGEEVKTRWGS